MVRKLRSQPTRSTVSSAFLAQYYPFHYEVGFAVEREMRDPRLTQHQNIILWIIHAAGGDRAMPRKDIETLLGPWFDVSSSAISKAVRAMASPRLKLLTVTESPDSGREKMIGLTAAGSRAVDAMVERGEVYIDRIVEQLSPTEVKHGLSFLERVSTIVRAFPTKVF